MADMTQSESPEVKALRYVESLGLNSAYEHVQQVRKDLENKYVELNNLRNRRRTLEAFKADIEMEIIEDERSKHADMSQAQMDKHLKVLFSNHTDLRETRDEMYMLVGQIELIEHEIDLCNTDVKIETARLHELGGYFQFMAVLKQSQTSNTSNQTEDGNPWK
jgi:hypothetical protein